MITSPPPTRHTNGTTKGRQIAVVGELRVTTWQPDEGPKRQDLKVHARQVDFLARPRTSQDGKAA